MAIIGQGVQAGLGRVDYTPYLQGAMAGAQGIAQGISSVGKSAADAVQEYQKNKQANELLEADNAAMLRQLSTVPEYKQFVPDPDTIQKYQDKMIKGGLSLTENKKLNAELNVAFKVADNVFKIRQQQTYADQAAAATNRMKFELDTAKKDQAKLDQFNTQLAQVPQGELTPDKIFEIGVQLGAPSNVVNSAVGGRLDIGKYELSKKVNEANLAKDVLERQKLDLELERIKQANPGATVVDVDGNRAWKFVDQSGKVSYDPIKEPKVTPTTMQQLGSIVQMYKAGVANRDQVMVNAAITDFAEATGKKGSVWTLDAIGDELASFAAKVPGLYAPPAGGAGIRAAKPVSAEQKAPGTAPAPAAPSKQEVPVKTAGGAAVAQPGLPPQPVTPYTPAAQDQQQQGNAQLNAWLATIGANRDPNAVPNPRGELVNEYTSALVQGAPPPPVVDTNLFPAPAELSGPLEPSMRFGGYDYPAMSALGAAERLASLLGPVGQQVSAPGRAINELGRYGAAALTGLATGEYTVPQQGLVDMASETMAKYLSRPNLAGETVRSLAQGAGMVPDTTPAGAPTNLPSATLDIMAQPLEGVSAARERMRREEAAAAKKGAPLPSAKAAAQRPMQSAELPQISLSKDAKRIADLLLQEYENKKGGKAPTFTITAAREGGKETSIKLSNPAILAVLSNPTNFGGLIRGNVETFSQQNARMNQILAEMEAARAARTRAVRGR